MPAATTDLPLKPRVLIADDSRIVRATLIKHIEGVFEFREASDGMEAWETLLIDPNIQIVLSDLTMPRLDGYGLLERIRNSKIPRIRSLPVVIVSGSQDQPEQDRARAAGATDLIGKGMSPDRAPSPEAVVDAVGQLLARTVRQSDCVALTDAGEFTLATTSVRFAGVRGFADRVCTAIATAHLLEDEQMIFVASAGLVALDDVQVRDEDSVQPDLATMRRIASRRALIGFNQARSGVIGAEEEKRVGK